MLSGLHEYYKTAHLDIKPDNILLHQGKFTLGDMGVSRPLNPADDDNPSLPGSGTPAYVPKEALPKPGEVNYDEFMTLLETAGGTTATSNLLQLPLYKWLSQFDVFTLGVTGVELINNEPPNRLKREVKVGFEKYYHVEVLDWIKRMLAERPEERPDSEVLYFSFCKLGNDAEKCGVKDFAKDEMFEGLDRYESWFLFHDLVLKKNNEDPKSKKKYGDEMFFSSREKPSDDVYLADVDPKKILQLLNNTKN